MPGVLDKGGELLPDLSAVDVERLVADGTVPGGMILKLESAVDAVKHGAKCATIVDGRADRALIAALYCEGLNRVRTTPPRILALSFSSVWDMQEMITRGWVFLRPAHVRGGTTARAVLAVIKAPSSFSPCAKEVHRLRGVDVSLCVSIVIRRTPWTFSLSRRPSISVATASTFLRSSRIPRIRP